MVKVVLNSTFEVDGLDPTSEFALTFQEASFENLTTRGGTFSVLAEFAKTASNISFFGLVDNFNSSSAEPYRLYDCDVYDDLLLVFSGVFVLVETNHTLKGRVFGSAVGLFDQLKGVQLSDLDLSALNHGYTASNVNTRRQNTSGVVYPNINYGLWTGQTHPASGVDFTEFYPAVYVDDIIEAACTLVGYTYTPIGSDLILPFSKERFNNNKSVFGSLLLTGDQTILVAATPVGVDFNSIVSDPLNYYVSANGNGFNLTSGNAKFTGTINYSASGANGADVTVGLYAANGGTLINEIVIVGPGDSGTIDYEIEASTVFSFGNMVIAIDGNNIGDEIVIEADSTFVLESGDLLITSGDTIAISDTLPDLDCVELFKFVATKNNALMIVDNKEKTFEFKPFNDIAGDFSRFVDWSDKVQDSDEVRLLYHLSEYAQNNYLQYKVQPEADPSRNITQIGRGNFTIDDSTLQVGKVLYEAPFCRSSIYEGFSNKVAMIFIPRYSDPSLAVDAPDIDPEYRILKSVIDDSLSIRVVGTTAPATQCNPVFESFSTYITDHYGSLSTAFSRLKVIEVDLQLNNFDIEFFDVTRPVFLLNCYWFVLKIEQFVIGKGRPTKVKLLRLY